MKQWKKTFGQAVGFLCCALSLSLLDGCAATSPGLAPASSTSSEDRNGNEPQVIIRTEDPERVRQAAIALVSQFGGKLLRAQTDQLLFSKAGKVVNDSSGVPTAPVYFVRLTLNPAGPGRVRVSASGMINGPRPTELSDARARTLLMAGLLRLQAAVEAGN